MASSGKEIKFLAVARKSDKSILATHTATSDKAADFAGSVAKVLNSPGWSSVTTDKLCLDDPPNAFYVTIDEVRRSRRWWTRCCVRGTVSLTCMHFVIELCVWRHSRVMLSWCCHVQAGRVYIAITSKGYPSRYIYGSPDGSTRGVLSGMQRAHSRTQLTLLLPGAPLIHLVSVRMILAPIVCVCEACPIPQCILFTLTSWTSQS